MRGQEQLLADDMVVCSGSGWEGAEANVTAAQARQLGLLRRAEGMQQSPLQCCHAEAPGGVGSAW